MKLSKQSKQLLSFFMKHDHTHYHPPTKKTQTILKRLYGILQEAHAHFSPRKVSMKRVSSVSQITKPRFFNANSFPEPIRTHIDETVVSEIAFSYSLFDRDITVIFMLENEHVDHELEVCTKYMESIAAWLYVLHTYSSKECATSVTIYLYFTSLRKWLPTSNVSVLNQNNVNTAFTTSCPAHAEIVVFRKEEWFKVLIHETFHSFGLDFSDMRRDTVDKCVLSLFQVQSEVNAYEAYTEFWAEMMNAMFCAFYHTKDLASFLSSFDVYIHFERSYSFFQLVKTLQFMGLTYADLLLNTAPASVKKKHLYKEKTNVLAYYVLKTVLLNNYQGFLGWCNTHNFSLLQFKKTIQNLKDFCEFIKKNCKTKSMLLGIQEAEDLFLHLSRSKGGETLKDILSNMRMTILELG